MFLKCQSEICIQIKLFYVLPDMKCNSRAVIGYSAGLYVMSGQAYAKTVTTRSATARPFRVKWYGRQCVESTNGGSIIGFSGSSVVPNTYRKNYNNNIQLNDLNMGLGLCELIQIGSFQKALKGGTFMTYKKLSNFVGELYDTK